MKKLIVALVALVSMNVFAGEKLELGLYVPTDGSPCAYEVVKQTNDGVVVVFRKNPTTTLPTTCAVGIDYTIAAEIIANDTFVDLRTDRVFKLYKKATLKLGLYIPADGDSCAYQVVKQTNDGVVVVFRYNPTVKPTRKCAVGLDYPIAANIIDSETLVDLRTDRVFNYHSEF